jgi:hypothetical protein
MKRTITCAVLLLLTLSIGAVDAPAIGLRGSTWGELRYDIPKEGEDNLIWDGWIKQGIDWKRWGNTTLNTYATFRYKLDTQKYGWNNAVGPGLGISLDLYSPKGLIVTMGAEYIWERQLYNNGDYYQKTFIYLNWVGWWDLNRR